MNASVEEIVRTIIKKRKEQEVLDIAIYDLERQLSGILDIDNAMKFADPFFVEGKTYVVKKVKIPNPSGTFDQSILQKVREVLSPNNHEIVYKKPWEETKKHPGKYDGVKLSALAKQVGGELLEIVEESRFPVRYVTKIMEVK